MPIGKVWVYRLLFVCVFVFLCLFVCTVMDLSAEDKAIAASNSAGRFIGLQGRESHI